MIVDHTMIWVGFQMLKPAKAVGNDCARIELTIANVPQLCAIRIRDDMSDIG